MEWSFSILLKQPLTREQADAFDHCDALADGAISYTLAPEDPDAHPQCADSAMLRELACDIEAPTLLDAVAQAVQRIRLIDGLHAVGVTLPDTVTLDEAAQRSGHGAQPLAQLSQDQGFPEPESGEGTVLYSWDRVAAFLRDIGEPVPDVPQDLVIAELALRLVNALDGADVSPGTLRALGLPID
ncbi:hypothetical protein F3K40_31320 [Streptomyces sp. LBUM 1478]|uniref:hypothetical protein n=1 Tax=unclassified Streptomyces TaxID=2593676 RepID=UPI000CD50A78|nr:hypothetical protein [Streptomyces sp. SM1]MBP5909226.1 hypothetical protein [Streptomyces sp. LBUM 1478]